MAEATNSVTSAALNGWAAHYSHSVPKPEPATGVRCTRLFSKPGISPYSEVTWERRTASITDATGGVDLRAKRRRSSRRLVDDRDQYRRFEVPPWPCRHCPGRVWRARNRCSPTGRPGRRDHPRLGLAGGYFATPEDAAIFHDELVHLLVTQKVAFNSPVWFNVGCDGWSPTRTRRTGIGIRIAARSSSP